ncbi:MAG TPA: DUF2177 family protein [Sedimentisphaerales bacterium]|nr:DUF2177 family protein [Sedimentisphaerales bacterium]
MVAYYTKLYLATLFAFLLIDGIWLGLVARGFYGRYLGYLLRPSPNWFAAILFYLLFVGALLLFVVLPALQHESWKRALVYGAIFGLVTYATYDLTNLATIKDWPLIVTVVDLAWGTAIGAAVSSVGFLAGRLFS